MGEVVVLGGDRPGRWRVERIETGRVLLRQLGGDGLILPIVQADRAAAPRVAARAGDRPGPQPNPRPGPRGAGR